MAVIDYGHTWWGGRWLDALTHIDYSNRLPRGKRYARNGSVASITLDCVTISAKVSGRRRTPYSVRLKLWNFTSSEQDKIVSIVMHNPYYLSQLEARILPPELEQELSSAGIRLFPSSWKNLGMYCSCPDWAVPCKHLAAVVYITANEIDKNPFLVFTMHGLDLLKAVRGKSEDEISSIPLIDSLTETGTPSYAPGDLGTIDMGSIPDLSRAVESLLTQYPLFYPEGDFKQVLTGALKKLSRKNVRYVKDLEITEELPDVLYSSFRMSLKKKTLEYTGTLSRDDDNLKFSSDDMESLIEYIRGLPAGDIGVYPPVLALLILIHSLVLKLMENCAAVPDLIALPDNTCIIRWIPSLYSREVKEITDILTDSLPGPMVFYGKEAFARQEQVLFLFSMMFTYYLRLFNPVPGSREHPVTALFFDNHHYRPRRFEQRGNTDVMHLWLGRFFSRPSHYFPVIHISEAAGDHFSFEIKVGDRRQERELPVRLTEFMERTGEESFPLLRDLSLLGTYLGTVHDALKGGGVSEVAGEEFFRRWFGSLPVLKTLGVRTVVPKALREAFLPNVSLRIRSVAGSSDSIVSYTSLRDMLDFDWTISAGGEFLAPEELLELRKRYTGYARYKEMFLELDEKHLDKISRKLEKPLKRSPLDLLKTGLTGTFDGVPVDMDDDVSVLFEALLKVEETPVPVTLRAELRPYQERGYQWLCHNFKIGLGSVLADDMGLGKTLQVIAFLLKLKNDGIVTPKNPALIIVPATLMTNWEHELLRFAPDLAAGVYHGTERAMPDHAEIIITTYALVRRESDALNNIRWSVAVADEAQNIKNPGTSQARAVKSIKAKYALAMTGTPVENRLLDYWSILDFVMKGYMGNRSFFKEAYAVPIERYREMEVLDTFRKVTSPLVLRRVKTDKDIISDLPDKLISNRYLSLSNEQKILYQDVVDQTEQMLKDKEGIGHAGAVFKLMTSLKQVCCHPALYTKRGSRDPGISGKSEMLLDLLDSVRDRDEKALVFTQYAQMGALLQEFIENRFHHPCLFLHGGSTRKQRDQMIEAFQNDPDHSVMILSIKAGGVGLNLTAANHVIHYDLWWNPAVENQATDRAFRIGQDKTVTVYRLITRGTFEEQINAMIESKEELAGLTVSKGEQWLTKLPQSELKELIRLRDTHE